MTKLPKDIGALETLFERHHIPRRHLRPLWMRLCRSIGLDPKPPLLFSLAEHYYWEGLPGIGVVVVGYLVCWWTFGTSPVALMVLIAFSGLVPLVNWTIRRRLRERLEG